MMTGPTKIHNRLDCSETQQLTHNSQLDRATITSFLSIDVKNVFYLCHVFYVFNVFYFNNVFIIKNVEAIFIFCIIYFT